MYSSDRKLAGTTSAANWVVSGTGIASAITALTTYMVTVTARDSSNNNIGHGGDTFLIQISNKWTMSNAYNWDVVSGATNTVSNMIYEKMTDNGDGTYSYNYSVNNIGAITVIVKLANTHGLDWIWYSSFDWTGTPQLVNITQY